MENLESITKLVLKPLVDEWLSAKDAALRERQSYDDLVWMIREFYRGAIDFVWSEKFTKRYMGGKMTPRFKVGLNKTFQYVALNIPGITWDQVTRIVKFKPGFEYGPELLGVLGGADPFDPQVQQGLAQLHQQFINREAVKDIATGYQTKLLDLWLNYTPTEMPDGTMVLHQERAAVDALISGRGVLWPDKYQMPGSQITLTGCEWKPQDDLLIDPDVRLLSKAQYIMLRCVDSRREVERFYGLPDGALRKAVIGSDRRRSERNATQRDIRRGGRDEIVGDTYDQVVYYKIWTKIGLTGLKHEHESRLRNILDKRVGNFAYLVVCDGCDYPLNCPPSLFENGTNEQIQDAFAWPTPFWLDGKWPFVNIDFYEREDQPYPIPPLAAGLGPLVYMNIAMSNLANRVWSSSRDFIAILESAYKKIAPAFENGDDLALIKVPMIADDLNKIVQFLKQPPVSAEHYTMLDRMMAEFVEVTGLSPLMGGGNVDGTQSRSAADANNKQTNVGVRLQFMRRKFDLGMVQAADMEKFVAWRHVRGKDVRHLVGDVGSAAWDMLITNEPDPEKILRSMRVTIDAQSGRRPNRDKDIANLKELSPAIFPELSKHADITGDTRPVKGWLQKIGEAMEQDMSPVMEMGDRVPMAPPPEVLEQQQQLQHMEMQSIAAKTQADIIKAQAGAQKAQADMTKTMLKAQIDQQALAVKSEELQLEKAGRLIDMMLTSQEKSAESAMAAESQAMDLAALELSHAQDLTHSEEKHAQEMQQLRESGELKRKQAAAMAKAKPKAKAKAGAK